MSYVQIAQKKQQEREARIPEDWRIEPSHLPGPEILDVSNFVSTCGLLSKNEIEIIYTPARQLIKSMIAKDLTSYEVTRAFCKAAAVAHQTVNPLTEIFFEYGLNRAKQIDEEYALTGKVKGPLHGLPVSIKDQFHLKGYDSTIGFASFAFKPATENSYIVDILEEAGAVLYVKTNVPPGMFRAETTNNLFSRTVCPYNRNLGAGGSSGGEGSLVAARGSPLGLGTDLAGSIRIPSAFCNLYGLKPTSGRIPLLGSVIPLAGHETIAGCAGPMSNDLDSLELLCKAVSDAKPWIRDPSCIPIPWKQDVQIPEKLRIGVILDDGTVRPTPPVANTLNEFVNVLERAGHTIIKLSTSPNEKISPILVKLFVNGGPGDYHKFFGDEDIPQDMSWFMDTKPMSVAEQWKLNHLRNIWKKEVYDMWADNKLDCILSPAAVFSSPPHEKFKHLSYTATYNVIDFPAVTIPVSRANPENSKMQPGFKPRNELEKQVYEEYDPNEIEGAPICLQVIGHKYEDEKLLEVARTMSNLVQKN